MPVSGYEEPGVKPLALHSRDSIAGVPIKKRRFPLVRAQSPPSQTLPSLPVESDLSQNKQSHSKLEPSSSNADGTAGASGVTSEEKSSSLDVKGENSAGRTVKSVQENNNPPGFNLQEQTSTMASGSGTEIRIKGKIALVDRSALQKIPGTIELQLTLNEACVPQIVGEMSDERKSKMDSKSKVSRTAGNTESKEPSVPDSAGQNSKGESEQQEKLDPHSWNLALTKKQNKVESESYDSKSKVDCPHRFANRSHWDLNTMMDTWEGHTNDAATAHRVSGVCGLEETGMHSIRSVICSAEMVVRESKVTDAPSGKLILDGSEHRSNFPSLSSPPDQKYKAEDLLHLHLSPSELQSSLSLGPCPSSEIDSQSVLPNSSLSETSVTPDSNLSLAGCRIVKFEPFDEGSKQNFEGVKVASLKLVDSRTVKSETVERYCKESLKSSNISNLKLVDHSTVKSEPFDERNEETVRTVGEGILNGSDFPNCTVEVPVSREVLQSFDSPTCLTANAVTGRGSYPLESATCTMGLPIKEEVSNNSKSPTCTKVVPVNGELAQEAHEIVDRVASDMVSEPVGPDDRELKIADDMLDIQRPKGSDSVDIESSGLKLVHNPFTESYENGEVAESDEEKFNIPTDMLEEDSYSTDYESDGNHAIGGDMNTDDKQHGAEDDDYEDGEVREPLVHAAVGGGLCEEREVECVDYGEYTNVDNDVSGFPGDEHGTTSHVEDRDINIENPGEAKNNHCSEECHKILLSKQDDQGMSNVASLQEPLAVDVAITGSIKKMPIKVAQRKPLEDGPKSHELELTSDRASSANQGTATGNGQGDMISQQENVKGTGPVERSESILPKMEHSLKDDEAVNKQSRTINFRRVSNGSSLGRARPSPVRALPLRHEREIFSDVVLREDKLPQGNRDESYMNRPRRFVRERNQDQPGGNSGLDFMHERGRVDIRLDTLCGDWNSDNDFGREHYNGPTGLRYPRPKNQAAVAAAKLKCNGYIVAPDGTIVRVGRGGRKPLNDEPTSLWHPPLRRQSPGVREGPVTHGVHMVRRPPRDISSDRCIVRGSPDVVGLRHEEKFMRGLPNDMVDPVFSHPQTQYERVDDPFVRGNRAFPTQRRGRTHLESPPRSRTRSPGPWSSSRTSPVGFDGHPELTHRGSPPIYRMERMRSPHRRPCFAEEMVARRHGSPPYMSRLPNDIREMGSAREHDRPRSFIPNRSPSGRGLPRNTRRFDMIHPRARTESDEYFGEPVHSGRFHELEGDGGAEERGKCSERRGPVRSFRPPYNGADIENFRYHVEDGPRPYRFCPEADTEFQDTGSSREREFDRRIKNRPGNALRRTRNFEEQEGTYRHGEQGWSDGVFDDDVSQLKRRRF